MTNLHQRKSTIDHCAIESAKVSIDPSIGDRTIAHLISRYGIRPNLAATVAELAGIGGGQ